MEITLFGIRTQALAYSAALKILLKWAVADQPRYVSTCTVYTLMMARETQPVFNALAAAAMVTADGMPLVWLQRRAGIKEAERVYGPDLLMDLCEQGRALGLRHYFCGGLPGVAEKLAANLQQGYPDLQILGVYSPPVEEFQEIINPQIIERLNTTNANIIWVGLGSPKQDLWMHLYRPFLHAPLLIGVGAAFDFHSKNKRQAPKWMQRYGLEWLFRLIQEPRRLWQRYSIYNFRFLLLLIRSLFVKNNKPLPR